MLRMIVWEAGTYVYGDQNNAANVLIRFDLALGSTKSDGLMD